ncbi:PAS domain-containing protein [Luteococcus sediminum]
MSHVTERVLQCAGDAVIVIDTDGRVTVWNAASEKLFGHRAEDVMGQQLDFMIPERLRQAHDKGFEKAMAQGHVSTDGAPRRTKAIHADGSSVYVVMTFAVVTGEDGSSLGSVAVAREWVRE